MSFCNHQGMDTNAINQINQQCYDACADTWDRFPFPDFLPALLIEHHRPELGKKALDIGSGTGRVAHWLTSIGFDVTCLDPSYEMVQRCRKKGLSVIQSTIQEFDSRESFSAVLAILSLIHVPKQEFPEQLKKIHRLLADRGLFVLALLEGEEEGIEENGFPRYFVRYQIQEVRDLISPTFQEVAFQKVQTRWNNYLIFFFLKI